MEDTHLRHRLRDPPKDLALTLQVVDHWHHQVHDQVQVQETESSEATRLRGTGREEDMVQEKKDKESEEKGTMDHGASAYKEGYMDIVGRVLLATRSLSVGEVVVEDSALVAAPDGAPVCLGCLGGLTNGTPVNCVNCGWPLCR